jgi:uncharacterized protein YdaU (DUF1376 family)
MGQIKWYKRDPDAALSGMMGLSLEERGAYNTVLDLIYTRDGNLPDDERFVAGWLGVDVRVWRRIKNRLIDLGKLYVAEGMLRNSRADVEVLSALSRVGSAQDAGRASARSKARKSHGQYHENNDLTSTTVETDASTTVSTNHNHNQIEEPNGSSSPHVPPTKKSAPVKPKKIAMPPDWQPTDLSGDVGVKLAEWPPGRLEAEIAEFREYWIEDGEKRLGWDRTFRSRIRNIHDRVMREQQNGTGYRQKPARSGDGALNELERRIQARRAAQPAGEDRRSDFGEGGSVGELPFASTPIGRPGRA